MRFTLVLRLVLKRMCFILQNRTILSTNMWKNGNYCLTFMTTTISFWMWSMLRDKMEVKRSLIVFKKVTCLNSTTLLWKRKLLSPITKDCSKGTKYHLPCISILLFKGEELKDWHMLGLIRPLKRNILTKWIDKMSQILNNKHQRKV